MAPKKQTQKMALGDFLNDQSLGSWADEMEDMPVAPSASDRPGYGDRRAFSSAPSFSGDRFGGDRGGDRGDRSERAFAPRQQLPLPTKPPYTAHLGNLPFDATNLDIEDFFADCEVSNVRIVEDKMDRKPKGFGYVEFRSLEGLKKALDLSGTQFKNRDIRVSVADPPKDRPEARELNDWTRKGPLPDLPQQQQRRASERGNFGSGYEAPPMERGGSRRSNFNEGDGKVRDFNTWERKGPLSPVPGAAAPQGREGGRPRGEPRERKLSPSWGEGRSGESQDGSRPPRREFAPRPAAERQPTAAEMDKQWRSKMRPDAPAQSTSPTPEPSTPSSPAQPAAPAVRPKLNLAKRTVSEAQPAEAASGSDSKASPFGAARPIDTATREREVAEKREVAIRQKREADEKAREEKKAREAAAKEEAATAEEDEESGKANGEKENGDAQRPSYQILAREADEDADDAEPTKDAPANGEPADDNTSSRPAKPREFTRDPPRGPRADRRGGGGGGRGEGGEWRRKSSTPGAPASPRPSNNESVEEDGWSTVPSKQRGRGRGGARAVAS